MVPCTFHPFPRLPWDVRRMIWEMTIEPRTVSIRLAYGPPRNSNSAEPNYKYYTRVFSSTPAPAPLQTCAEARHFLSRFYQRISTGDYFPQCSDDELEPHNNSMYFWLNWDIGMIDIHDCPFAQFYRIAPMIKRLKFETDFEQFSRDRDEDYWADGDEQKSKTFKQIFPNVEEMHIVCAPGCKMEEWESAWWRYLYFVRKEKLFIIDAEDPNRIMNFAELEDFCGNNWSCTGGSSTWDENGVLIHKDSKLSA